MKNEFIQRILVPVDGSTHSTQAVMMAVKMAKQFSAEIYFIQVKDVHTPAIDAYLAEDILLIHDRISQSIIQSALQKVPQNILSYSCVLEGQPGRVILDYANEIAANLIIMGSRGLGTIKAVILGSVSQEVLAESKIPVMICK
ncbi:Nucleotide-binding universal stress protein, UspA family [Propionispira arboris]|uniref:Nucleotide-binding universal stress protein, UspA family n=1 Tax=Propionispira arboris TaxID=84035 RepID=A0A1H7BRB6_9FIRM|nr:universal stress protein [Propionispira arboris]SEJ80233.1 Nucleotide-binding universal stress protein, UspA family [Propionispira arboris]